METDRSAPGACIRVTWYSLLTAGRITLGQQCNNPSRELFSIASIVIVGTLICWIIVQKHVYILDTILQNSTAPFYLIEEELALKAPGYL